MPDCQIFTNLAPHVCTMTASPATILIPDISGFTEFMTNTELSHGSFAISMLIETIIDAVKDDYEISEIEGDAVLMYKRGPAPSHKEMQDTCLKIFNAFHFRRSWMEQHAVCPCKACAEITHLTLKFVGHHGSVGEIKAGGFTKLSGTDVIVAHRLLKNNVPSHEYLLLTEKLLQHSGENPDPLLNWSVSSEHYPSIGKVDYRFALLNEEKTNLPTPPTRPADHSGQLIARFEIPIAVNYRDAYMVLMNIPERSEWVPSLQKTEQDASIVFVGSVHRCTFDKYTATISPLRMTILENEIIFSESCMIEEKAISLVHDYTFKKTSEHSCLFTSALFNAGTTNIGGDDQSLFRRCMQEMAEGLQAHCGKQQVSFFQ